MKLRLADTESPTWLIISPSRCDCNNSNVPYEFFMMLTPRSFDISPSSVNTQFSGPLFSNSINDAIVSCM